MSGICNITPGFLLSYIEVLSKPNIKPEDIFKQLSYEMGGDGSSISKDQLDNYINKAESGDISITKQKLHALKQIQKNWDTISNGKDNISYSDIAKYKCILFETLGGGFEVSEDGEIQEPSTEIYNLLKKNLGVKNLDDATISALNNHLKTLLTKDSSDDEIGDTIDALINLMANKSNPSNVSMEA